ncbi:hypothetical protein [Lactobacillus amylovorus]|nr:hypothetical protein [Lactobacillus amylovorus]MDB6264562.1 hypothetical protein [Lactobacillus amylovorus]MDB6270065.1 hypothetical protein [Lactobacillus amylovorus]
MIRLQSLQLLPLAQAQLPLQQLVQTPTPTLAQPLQLAPLQLLSL